MPATIESLKAAEQLGDSYKAAYEEIANLRRSLNRGSLPEVNLDGPEPEESQDAQERVKQFKDMLADRRAAALAAFSAADETERVQKLQAMLADCKAPPPPMAPPRSDSAAAAAAVAKAQPTQPASVPREVASKADEAIKRAGGGKQRAASVFDKLMDAGKSTRAKIDEKRREEHEAQDGGQKRVLPKQGDLAVVDRLQKAHKETKARLDEARRAKTVEERNMCREPKISKKAQDLNRGGNVGDRLMQYGKQRAERIAAQEQQHREAMEAETVGQPQINEKSQRLDRNVEMYFAWEARKNLRLQQQQEKQKQDEMAEVKSAPTISRNSARIVKQMNRASKIEEQLLTQAQLTAAKKKQQQEQVEEAARSKRTPKISVHSAALERPGHVCDRLYMLAQEKQHVQMVKSQRPRVAEEPNQPRINNKSRALVNQSRAKGRSKSCGRQRVEDRLLANGQKYRQKADARAKAVKSHEVCTTKPRVGPYSQLLVELMEKRTGSTASKRLQQPTRQLKRSTLQDLEEEELNLTFQPELNRHSRTIDRMHNQNQDRRDLLFQRADEYEFKRARLQEQYMKKEMEECTFNPQIPEANRRVRAGQAKQDDEASFIERNMKWIRQRDRQREATRHDAQKKAAAECTFTPDLRNRSTLRAQQEMDEEDEGWSSEEDPVLQATRRAWEAEERKEQEWEYREEEHGEVYSDDDCGSPPRDDREDYYARDEREDYYGSPQREERDMQIHESPYTEDESVFAVSSPDESPDGRQMRRAEHEANDWIKRAVGAASSFQ